LPFSLQQVCCHLVCEVQQGERQHVLLQPQCAVAAWADIAWRSDDDSRPNAQQNVLVNNPFHQRSKLSSTPLSYSPSTQTLSSELTRISQSACMHMHIHLTRSERSERTHARTHSLIQLIQTLSSAFDSHVQPFHARIQLISSSIYQLRYNHLPTVKFSLAHSVSFSLREAQTAVGCGALQQSLVSPWSASTFHCDIRWPTRRSSQPQSPLFHHLAFRHNARTHTVACSVLRACETTIRFFFVCDFFEHAIFCVVRGWSQSTAHS
jgi:hypothetical protein